MSNNLIPRCARCNEGGVTNVKVVSMATKSTPLCEDGDFLCVFHHHETAVPIPTIARREKRN